ncbi:unnamed protein product [Medioppia subpectinata]|uniref:Uncharacterized protein n=1 Tax=Medioppia subpectinata TaxID=1979941 RepID=A0A7R9QLD7_9ACAR|nr:unnamed protein product [Medioppia subpectinata]CAG2122291.1 unnamed protein product [Medioppia subpectinata]
MSTNLLIVSSSYVSIATIAEKTLSRITRRERQRQPAGRRPDCSLKRWADRPKSRHPFRWRC